MKEVYINGLTHAERLAAVEKALVGITRQGGTVTPLMQELCQRYIEGQLTAGQLYLQIQQHASNTIGQINTVFDPSFIQL